VNLRAKTHIFFSKGVLQFKSPRKTHKTSSRDTRSGTRPQLQHDAFNPASLRPLRNESHFLRQILVLGAQRCANTCLSLPSPKKHGNPLYTRGWFVFINGLAEGGPRRLHYSAAAGVVESKNVCVCLCCVFTRKQLNQELCWLPLPGLLMDSHARIPVSLHNL
jgi:hypothetical protein